MNSTDQILLNGTLQNVLDGQWNNSTVVNTTTITVLSVYKEFERSCTVPNPNFTTAAISFLVVYGLGIPLQLSVLPANWRLSKHRSAFLLLFQIGIFDTLWLLQYVWLSVEFLVGHRLVIPLMLEAYPFRFVNYCIDAFYQLLAFNRVSAVLFPVLYEAFFNLRITKLLIGFIWFLALLYSVYTNWLPERRPFHCLQTLGYFEPTTALKKDLLATLPDTTFYDTIQAIDIIFIYIPLFLYILTSIKMIFTSLRKKYSKSGMVVHEPVTTMLQSETERLQFTNLERERTRLYLMCLLSTWPYYLSYSLYFFTRTFEVDVGVVNVMAVFWQLLGMIFHVQQPVCMLLLSKDLRRAVKEDFEDATEWIKAKLCG